ncbi:alpha/beta fold hydrolase [Psychrosphaera aestuarii]|uniref:alpha/beta fold hydrolase n=1 Tax=Psychrosphaera aestuarii TaxID=1266052 RepID=UPI001B32F947|nr:alpha/beta fold hydrolase [Psychrosphaera aestuarii]
MNPAKLRAFVLLSAAFVISPFGHALNATASLNLEKCFVDGVKSKALCGTYTVPENRAKALSNDNKIDLNVVVLPRFKEESKALPVVFLAGGPGQAATELAGGLNMMLNDVRQQHDIILVDQRGTGKSSPIACDQEGIEPLSFDERKIDLAKEVAKCVDSAKGKHLPSYNSIDSIKDIEAVREALGHKKVHIFGGSYGTRAGFTYLQQFPESIETATLDSNAPMQLVIGFFGKTSERAFDLLVEDCKAHEECNKSFPDLKNDYLTLVSRLKEQPVTERIYHPLSGKPVDMVLTRDKVTDALRSTLYALGSRVILPYAVNKAANGDYRAIAAMIGQTDDPKRAPGQLYAGLTINILCNEDFSRASDSDYQNDADNYFNGERGYSALSTYCEYWPRWAVDADFNKPLKTSVPVLLFSGKYDPVTPPEYGDMAMETLENAKHIVIEQGSHVASFRTCLEPIQEFLKTSSLENLDFSCAEEVRPQLFFTNMNQIK